MNNSNGFVLKEDGSSHNESSKGHLLRSRFGIWHVRSVLQLNIAALRHPHADLLVSFESLMKSTP